MHAWCSVAVREYRTAHPNCVRVRFESFSSRRPGSARSTSSTLERGILGRETGATGGRVRARSRLIVDSIVASGWFHWPFLPSIWSPPHTKRQRDQWCDQLYDIHPYHYFHFHGTRTRIIISYYFFFFFFSPRVERERARLPFLMQWMTRVPTL